MSGTTTKADLVDAVYERVGGFSKREAADVVNRVFNILKERLASDQLQWFRTQPQRKVDSAKKER